MEFEVVIVINDDKLAVLQMYLAITCKTKLQHKIVYTCML